MLLMTRPAKRVQRRITHQTLLISPRQTLSPKAKYRQQVWQCHLPATTAGGSVRKNGKFLCRGAIFLVASPPMRFVSEPARQQA